MALSWQRDGPFREHARQFSRFFVVSGHFHAGVGAFQHGFRGVALIAAGLAGRTGWYRGAGFLQNGERFLGVRQAGEAS